MASSDGGARDAFHRLQHSLEDFWDRRAAEPRHHRELRLFGHSLRVESNSELVLEAAEVAARSYSMAEPSGSGFSMQIVVDGRLATGRDPSGHLPAEIHYAGSRDWLSMGLGPWGRVHVDLSAGEAMLILAPELAARPALLARWVIHTVWTNFLIRSGSGLLHATALHRDGTLVCFVAPHDSGKSSTALSLAFHGGFKLLSDSLLFVDGEEGGLRFNAFPVGRVSLRADTLEAWPALRAAARREPVRGEDKYDVDITAVAPQRVQLEAVCPGRVVLFLLGRHDSARTELSEVDSRRVGEALVANSMFHDSDAVWSGNLHWLDRLAATAECRRLLVGRDVEQMLAAVERAVAQTD